MVLMEEKSRKKNKETTKNTAVKRSRSAKIMNALPIVGLIALIVALIVTLIFVIVGLTSTPMKEINTDSELVAVPMGRYFYNKDGGCAGFEDILLSDGRKTTTDYSDELKEHIVVNFLINQKVNGYPYSYINEVYQAFFGKNENIAEKDVYETSDGKIVKNEYGTYVSESKCSAPEIYTCVVLDKAYKSDKNNTLKAVVGVFTVTSENGNVYPGLNHDGEALGVRTDFDVTGRLGELPKWELFFKIDKSTGLYQLVYTSKIS